MTSALSSLNTSPSYPAWHLHKSESNKVPQRNANDGQSESDDIPTSSIRETLCNLRPMEIPRPKCVGFQFVPTRGRYGFYQSLTQSGAEKMGFNVKALAPPKRPSLPNEWQERRDSKETVRTVDDNDKSEKISKNYDKRLANVTTDSIPEEPEQCKPSIHGWSTNQQSSDNINDKKVNGSIIDQNNNVEAPR